MGENKVISDLIRILRIGVLFFLICAACFLFSAAPSSAISDIVNTKHNLSVTGPGTIRALTESRICIFCHTPHNAAPETPLWNKDIEARNYDVYASPTLKAGMSTGSLPQPTGPTKLCLSCHDGTMAVSAVLNPAGGISMLAGTAAIPTTSPSYFGLNLADHHPVSFSYYASLPNPELASTPPPNLVFGGANAEIHCSTCHDPHDDTNGKFLSVSNRYSELCVTCHKINDWSLSGHATSAEPVNGILPVPPKTWPTWGTVAEWGCEVCHTPHFAASPQWLLNYTSADYCLSCHSPVPSPSIHPQSAASQETSSVVAQASVHPLEEKTDNGGMIHDIPTDLAQPDIVAISRPGRTHANACQSCHGSDDSPLQSFPVLSQGPPSKGPEPPRPKGRMADIRGQIKKISSHREQPGIFNLAARRKRASFRSMTRQVTCTDCHNPHIANKRKAVAPELSGMLQGVSGVDRNGADIPSARYEYEICFKCHSDYNLDFPYIPRVVNTSNTRLAFDPLNPSYHPVVQQGKNFNIPSIPSSYEPSLAVSAVIYCTDCHRDDSGVSKGPHGSQFAPILRERYETADFTPANYQNYALCYRCHSETSILSDVSFRKKINNRKTASGGGHSGHLAAGSPCSACHDPHGVYITSSLALPATGSHTNLINFDTRIAVPKPGSKFPFFTDTGTFSGSCTLVCHGVVHDNLSYP